jgi:hypothetical protein
VKTKDKVRLGLAEAAWMLSICLIAEGMLDIADEIGKQWELARSGD